MAGGGGEEPAIPGGQVCSGAGLRGLGRRGRTERRAWRGIPGERAGDRFR
jgi:hypothetical protein